MGKNTLGLRTLTDLEVTVCNIPPTQSQTCVSFSTTFRDAPGGWGMGRLLRGKQDFQFPHISSYSCSSATTATATPKQFVAKEAKPLFTKYPGFMGQSINWKAIKSNKYSLKSLFTQALQTMLFIAPQKPIGFAVVLKSYICLFKQGSSPLFFPLKSYSNSYIVLGFSDLSRPDPLPRDLYGVVGLSPIVWLRCHQDNRS